MAIAFANLGASLDPDINLTTNLTSYASASWTPPTADLLIVFCQNSAASAAAAVTPTVSGNSITYVEIATVINDINRISLFAANLSGATAGATTFAFAGNTQTTFRASFFQATGVNLTGGVAAAFVQKPTNSGAAATSGSVTLAAAGHADNRPISGFYHLANEQSTPRTSWTELDDLRLGTPAATLETQYRSDAFETTASATWATSVIWAGIAAELKATLAAGKAPPFAARALRMWIKRR